MQKCSYIAGTILTVIFILISSTSFGQDTGSRMDEAKALAKQKKYEQAEAVCRDILSKSDDGDVRFYLGLLYSWDGKYDDARREFSLLEQKRPGNLELINAQYNVEYWSGSYDAAVKILDKGIKANPKDVDLRLKKAKMLSYQAKKQEALAEVNAALTVDPASIEARNMLILVKNANCKNTISANYTVDLFNGSTDTWHSAYLQYGRRTSMGTVIGRINYANRYQENGLQAEADSYLSFWKGGYTYANIGFASDKVFPDFRAGFEYYHNLPASFEASLGFRYLKFSSSDLVLYTGSVGKYYSSYWFSVRPMFRFRSSDVSYSVKLSARRYFSDPETFVGLEGSYGTSPDYDHPNIDYTYLQRLKSWTVRSVYSQKLANLWVISGKVSFTKDEIIKGTFRNQLELDITVSKSF